MRVNLTVFGRDMKFKFLTLTVFLIILFSLGTVVASDNITSDDVCLASDSSDIVGDDSLIDESQDTSDEAYSGDEVDLSVTVSKLNKDLENTTIVEVPFNVIASVSGGTAHNTKIHIYYGVDDDCSYFTHNQTMGTYNPTTNIWDIGDLSSSDNACLTIVTKFNTHGKNLTSIGNIVIVNATTTSKDVNLSNNFLIQSVVYAAPIYYVAESDDNNGPQHNVHEGSEPQSSFVVIIGEENGNNGTDSQNSEDKSSSNATSEDNSKSNYNSKSKNDEGSKSDSNSVVKVINQDIFTKAIGSLTDALPKSLGSLGSLVTDLFGLEDSSTDNNSDKSSKSVEGAEAYDYTRIPLLVFAVFLIMIVAVAGYDKIKS